MAVDGACNLFHACHSSKIASAKENNVLQDVSNFVVSVTPNLDLFHQFLRVPGVGFPQSNTGGVRIRKYRFWRCQSSYAHR